MKSPRLTEDDLKQFEANMRKIKGVVPQQSQTRVRRPKPVRAGADGQDASLGRTVPPVTSSPYKSKWEAAYAAKLELEKRAGHIKAYWYEPFSLWLPGKVRYKPDFLIQYPDGMEQRLEVIEVKGWSKNRRDGMTRLKIAAALFPCFVWRMVSRTKGGGWDGEYL